VSEFYVTTIPLIGRLGTIVQWVFLLNALLIGCVVFFAYRAAALRARVEQLENELSRTQRDHAAGADSET
jgi:hypothetical protein